MSNIRMEEVSAALFQADEEFHQGEREQDQSGISMSHEEAFISHLDITLEQCGDEDFNYEGGSVSASVRENSTLMKQTAAARHGSRSKVEEKSSIHSKSFSVSSPRAVISPMKDLESIPVVKHSHHSTTSKLYQPTQAFVNSKYVQPEPVVETIRELPGTKARIDVPSKLHAPTASSIHGQYVPPEKDASKAKSKASPASHTPSPSHPSSASSPGVPHLHNDLSKVQSKLFSPTAATRNGRYVAPEVTDEEAYEMLAKEKMRRALHAKGPPRCASLPTKASEAGTYDKVEMEEESLQQSQKARMRRALAASSVPACASLPTFSTEFALMERMEKFEVVKTSARKESHSTTPTSTPTPPMTPPVGAAAVAATPPVRTPSSSTPVSASVSASASPALVPYSTSPAPTAPVPAPVPATATAVATASTTAVVVDDVASIDYFSPAASPVTAPDIAVVSVPQQSTLDLDAWASPHLNADDAADEELVFY